MGISTLPFVIVSQARSGSTMLGTALDVHPEVLIHGEIFGGHHFPLNLYGIDENLPWPTPLEIFLKKMRDTDITRFLSDVVLAETGRSAVGFKFKFEEFEVWPDVVEFIRQRKIPIIYMRRENLLERYLSDVESEATGYFNTTDKMIFSAANEDEIRLKLAFPAVKAAIDASLAFEAFFTAHFSETRVLPLTYEACVSNWTETSGLLCDFLGLNRVEIRPASEKRSLTRRINSLFDPELVREELCKAGYGESCGAIPAKARRTRAA